MSDQKQQAADTEQYLEKLGFLYRNADIMRDILSSCSEPKPKQKGTETKPISVPK